MSFVRDHIERHRPGRLQPVAGGPLLEFGAVSFALAAGLVAATASAPWDGAGATIVVLAVFSVTASIAAVGLARHYPHAHLGYCNAITLTRLALASALVAPLVAGASTSWIIFAVALVALSLDGFDGWLARRQGYVSGFGARFDMEVDSMLALVLAFNAAATSGLGPIALLLGVPRYVFALAAAGMSWMRRPLPDRFSRKVVCVVQLGALIGLQAPVLGAGAGWALMLIAAAALVWSFVVDILWLWQRRG